jgi:S1-C subfamily serine protease
LTNDLKVGDYVVAIGNPFGFSNTVTSGIVSGLGRQFVNSNEFFEAFIQTDASINPGNSGGALVNLNGELVGINSAIISETGGNVGIGFAIPSEMVVAVMDQLLEFGEVRRSLLGVGIDSVTPSFADDYGLNVRAGALVMSVSDNSAAERAGIRINDVIISVAGKTVADSNELRNTVAMIPPGEAVDVQIMRGTRERTISAVLDLNDQIARDEPTDREPAAPRPGLDGLALVEVPARSGGPGLRIESLSAVSRRLAEIMRANALLRGDLITAINQQPVSTIAEAEAIAEATRTVVLEIRRDARASLVRLR